MTASGVRDIGVRAGRIAALGELAGDRGGEVIDATGLTIFPGVIDTQVHFREPGAEHKEDLETGSLAAVMGGVTAVFEMPNTNPLTVSSDALEDKLKRARGRMHCDYAFWVGGTAENVEGYPGTGAAARSGRNQGVHGLLDGRASGARRQGGARDPVANASGAPPSTPRTNTG